MPLITKFPTTYRPPAAANHPVLDVLETYWRTLRLGTAAPARNRIDPSAIDTALPWAFIVQTTGHCDARVRVAGQKLHDMFRTDPRGTLISSLFSTKDHNALRDMIRRATTDPALVSINVTAKTNALGRAQRATVLFLPLTNDDGRVTRLLGAIGGENMVELRGRNLFIDRNAPPRIEPLAASIPVQHLQKGPKTQQLPALRLVVNNS